MNSRRLLDAVLEKFNVLQEKKLEITRAIDKLDKMGREGVMQALRQEGVVDAEGLLELLTPERTNAQTLEKFQSYDLTEIKKFFEYYREFQISEDNLQIDPSLARGLDYYTGLVFEVVGRETPSNSPFVRGRQSGSGMGTLCAGGRYDDLCSLFIDQSFSGIGVSFGFERIMMALEEREALKEVDANTQVLVANFGEEVMENALKIVNELTGAGINTEVYFEPVKLDKQLKYADKKQIPFVVLCGAEEMTSGEVKVKIMATGMQKSIPQNQLVSYIK